MNRMHRVLSICCAILLFCTTVIVPFSAKANTERWGAISDEVNVREGAGTSFRVITKIAGGEMVKILGEQVAQDGDLWYLVYFIQNGQEITGYIHYTYVVVPDDAFFSYLQQQGFPPTYYAGLILLHAKYPNWQFVAVHTNLKWADVIAAETVIGRNMVYYTSNPAYIDLTDVDANGNQIGRDGNSWVTASRAAVEYYMDPRNFLNDPSIFMFEGLSYIEGTYTKEGVQAILNGTFMAGDYTCPDTQQVVNYADTFLVAGQAAGVSPYHLASRAKQEQGKNGNALGNGTVAGYENYFNFFNIGAFATNSGGAILNGAKYASTVGGSYGRPWNNQFKSINGGAQFLGNSYITKGQDTVYFQKFNVANASNLYNHQYMSNVKAPASEASIVKNGYTAEVLNGVLMFKIPVYLEMPEQAIPKPEDRAQANVTPPIEGVNSVYRIMDTTVTGVTVGTEAAAFLGGFTLTNGGSIALYNVNGEQKTGGFAATGDVARILHADGSVYKDLRVVIYGDINGDGNISMADLVLTRKHLLELSVLTEGYFSAADINKDGKISMADLVFVRKHLLDLTYITQ